MPDVIRQCARCFDAAYHGWESPRTRRAIGSLLIAALYVLGVMSVYNLMVPVQQDGDGGKPGVETGET